MTTENPDGLIGWPGDSIVSPLGDVKLRVLPGTHPVLDENGEAITRNWHSEITANPALFDGRMIFNFRASLEDGVLHAEGYVTPFSAFIWWRRQMPRSGGVHISAYAAIETADGALVAIRMGAHTANAGQVYFAAGSFEPEDVIDGYCDVASNMRREVLEETGLDLASATIASDYHASHQGPVVTIFRLFRFDLTAEQMIERIKAHMQVAEDKEIAGAVAIWSADPDAQPYHSSMLPVLGWYFDKARNVGLR
ncbi:NUDIX hydrolase [Neorhizobium alkalisoli]|uniref:NUDIX domain-containing protein n=1 Tax=Neorhizobium alkalisoli TaxID=528178 RepID=A0A561QV98_9HYPH|nr:NUDIX hydrolase [Neorhizobium alkalisoli]TWF54282.1 hypothetical protein FHW37_103146 [Neorhizobium alkalisoli]